MKAYVVLIKVASTNSARDLCNHIENMEVLIEDDVPSRCVAVRNALVELLDEEEHGVEFGVSEMTDFMELVNDDYFDVDEYFMSYVYA